MLFISFIGASLFTDHLGRYLDTPDIPIPRYPDTPVDILGKGSKMDKDMEKQNMKAIKNEKGANSKPGKKKAQTPNQEICTGIWM